MKIPSLFLFCFTQQKAIVLYSKPHASISSSASRSIGNVAHINSAQPSPAVIEFTGICLRSSIVIVP